MISPQILGKDLDEVTRLVTLWQEALGLEDWDISVDLVDPRQMRDDWASCGYNYAAKTATISFTTDIATEEDLHSTIVHELFHLIFWWPEAEDDKLECKLLEQAFEVVTPVMAKLYLMRRQAEMKLSEVRRRARRGTR